MLSEGMSHLFRSDCIKLTFLLLSSSRHEQYPPLFSDLGRPTQRSTRMMKTTLMQRDDPSSQQLSTLTPLSLPPSLAYRLSSARSSCCFREDFSPTASAVLDRKQRAQSVPLM